MTRNRRVYHAPNIAGQARCYRRNEFSLKITVQRRSGVIFR
ncbi:hypothetical protein BN133_2926 [Cronobacter dublinensis 582]|nr:hypothetical protein BN133_2926 [Cronobacter dublinensis 582]